MNALPIKWDLKRPSPLIDGNVRQLIKDLHDPISRLAGKESKDLLQLVSKLQNYCSGLCSAIYYSLKVDEEGCLAAQ